MEFPGSPTTGDFFFIEDITMNTSNNKRIFIIAIVLMGGSIAHNISNHTFDTLRPVDLLSLIALGMLFGIVLVTGIQMIKKK